MKKAPIYLKTTSFSEILFWDVKRYVSLNFSSHFELVPLSKLIKARNQKVNLFDFPDEEFKILGVNNKIGLFDAYSIKGKEINQPYKKVLDGDLVYNPYRVNVGSIGLKTSNQKNEYISPAYVVFSCNEDLMPEFLFRLLKTDTFNNIIKNNTTGSVRQNLKFESLRKIKIPLPSLERQKKILKNFNKNIQLAEHQKKQSLELAKKITKFMNNTLGIKESSQGPTQKNTDYLKFINYTNLHKWGYGMLTQSKTLVYTKSYKLMKIQQICKVSSGGTPSRSIKEYYEGNVPWVKTTEVRNDVIYDTEEKITEEAISNSSAKLYPKGSLLVAMYGQGATRGRTAKLGVNSTTNQACAVLYGFDDSIIINDYLWYYLMNEYDRLRTLASGNNQPNLNAQMIKSYDVVVPPLEIQKKVVDQINKLKTEILELDKNSEENISLAMQELEKEVFAKK